MLVALEGRWVVLPVSEVPGGGCHSEVHGAVLLGLCATTVCHGGMLVQCCPHVRQLGAQWMQETIDLWGTTKAVPPGMP